MADRAVALTTDVDGDFDVALTWAAHELRRPLLDAHLAIQRLSEEAPDHLASIVLPTLERLSRLHDDLAAILRWGAGRPGTEPTLVDLGDVVRAAAGGSEDVAVTLLDPVRVVGDPAALEVAVRNLVINATIHGVDGRARVVVGRAPAGSSIAVTNRCLPMPSDLGELFAPYRRDARPGVDGSGLGLFMARRIVEAHGGTLTSRLGDDEVTFTIGLPLPGAASW